jgi:hypothetical protein
MHLSALHVSACVVQLCKYGCCPAPQHQPDTQLLILGHYLLASLASPAACPLTADKYVAADDLTAFASELLNRAQASSQLTVTHTQSIT